MRVWLTVIFLCLSPALAQSASFDCANAKIFAEKSVCANPLLSKLDDALAKNYRSMLSANFGGSKASLRTEQANWIKQRSKCTSESCLINTYRKRIDETCEYGVISGAHPECTMSEDIK